MAPNRREYEPAYENQFFREQREHFTNVWSEKAFGERFKKALGLREHTEVEKLDGKVLDAMERLKGHPTTSEWRKAMKFGELKRLKKFGGFEAALKRLEGIGVIYKEDGKWHVD